MPMRKTTDVSTTPAGTEPRARPRADSHVRFRPQATGFTGLLRRAENPSPDGVLAFLRELGDAQLTLTINLLGLEHSVDGLPYDVSVRAAGESLRARLQELTEQRSALDAVYLDASDPRMALLLGADAPLAGYLRGLYAWTAAVTRAIVDLAAGLRALDLDWASTRARIDDARGHHRADLESAIRADLARVALRAPSLGDPLGVLSEHLAELFWAASYLAKGLDKKFG